MLDFRLNFIHLTGLNFERYWQFLDNPCEYAVIFITSSVIFVAVKMGVWRGGDGGEAISSTLLYNND